MHLKTTKPAIHVNTASGFSVKQKPLAAVTEGDLIARPQPMCSWVHPAAASLQFPWITDTVKEHSSLTFDYPVRWRPPCFCPWRCLHFPSPVSLLLLSSLLNQSLPFQCLLHLCYTLLWADWRCSWWEHPLGCFLSPSGPFPSRTPCCIPRARLALVQCGHETYSVQAMSCAGSPELIQLHHSSQHTTKTRNKIQKASLPFCTRLTGKAGRNGRIPFHACLGKVGIYQFCLSYSPPSCPAGFPFSCAHDFGPPGTEFVLWKQNKAKRNLDMDQLRFMTVSHFLAGTCYGSGLQITQIPHVFTGSSWGYSQLFPTPLYYSARAKILCSALMSPLPIFTKYFLNLYSHQAFLLFCGIFSNGLLNLPHLFHATPQLEGYHTFSCINPISPL